MKEIVLTRTLGKEDEIEFRQYTLIVKLLMELLVSKPDQKRLTDLQNDFESIRGDYFGGEKFQGRKKAKSKESLEDLKSKFENIKGKELKMNVGKPFKSKSKKGTGALSLKEMFEQISKNK